MPGNALMQSVALQVRMPTLSIVLVSLIHFCGFPAPLAASTVEFTSEQFVTTELDWFGAEIGVSAVPASPVRVRVKAVGGTAQWPSDYSSNQVEVVIPLWPSDDRGTFAIPLGPVDDGFPEPDETVELEIISVEGPATLGARVKTTVTIKNSAPRLEFEVNHGSKSYRNESDAFAFKVNRSGDTNVAVSFDFQISSESTAIPGVDFAPLDGPVVLEPGERSKEFLQLLDDGVVEAPRLLHVAISNLSPGATMAGQSGAPLRGTNLMCVVADDEIPANLDLSFSPDFAKWPLLHSSQVAVQPDGKILLFGPQLYLAHRQVSVLRLHADGKPDFSFRAEIAGEVTSLSVAPDNKMFIVMRHSANSQRMLRLQPDGAVDPTFSVSLPKYRFFGDSIVQPDGKLLMGAVTTDSCDLIRLNTDGSLDPSWKIQPCPRPSYHGFGIFGLADGKLLRFDGDLQVSRLNSDGSVDGAFADPLSEFRKPETPQYIADVARLSDGRILVQLRASEKGSWDTGSWVPDSSPRATHLVFLRPDGTKDSHLLIDEPLVQYSNYDNYWYTEFLAEIDGYFYFTPNETGPGFAPAVVRLRPDGTLDKSFVIRWSDYIPGVWNTYGGPRGEIPAGIPHQGALLFWSTYLKANETSGALVRILVKDPPDSGFIFSSDPPLSFEKSFSADEADGEARIRVLRTGNVTEGAQVSYSTTDGTAQAGKDYVSLAGTLSFAPMEKEKVIVVPLLATPEFRRNPYFFVVLSLPSSPAALDQPAKVHIVDQEVGLIHKGVLQRFDSSLELVYSVSGQTSGGFRIETSLDLRNWRRVELNYSGDLYSTNPTGMIFSPQEKQGFLRVRVP